LLLIEFSDEITRYTRSHRPVTFKFRPVEHNLQPCEVTVIPIGVTAELPLAECYCASMTKCTKWCWVHSHTAAFCRNSSLVCSLHWLSWLD